MYAFEKKRSYITRNLDVGLRLHDDKTAENATEEEREAFL